MRKIVIIFQLVTAFIALYFLLLYIPSQDFSHLIFGVLWSIMSLAAYGLNTTIVRRQNLKEYIEWITAEQSLENEP